MAELGLGAAPVPSITVTFLSTVVSAKAGAAIASSATAAPNFRPCIFQLPERLYYVVSRRSYGRGRGKKTAKSFAAVRHGHYRKARQFAKNMPPKKIMPPSIRKAALSRVDPALSFIPNRRGWP